MKYVNQYSDDIQRYNEEHGTDIFKEYKDENTSEERKNEIVDFMFNLMRERNEVPRTILNYTQIMSGIIQLSEVSCYDVYRDGEYWFNTSGVNILSQFFPEMLDVEKDGKPSVNQMFHNDYRFRRAIEKTLKYSSSELDIFRWIILIGSGFCYNFRPATAKALYEIYGKPNCKVLDTSAGFGARMLGAHLAENENRVAEYLGIDPNTANSCNRLAKYLDDNFDTNTRKEVLKMGSEDFTSENFPQYQNYFDLAFTSPPYHNTEKYSKDETQSYIKFPEYTQWIKGFYRQTIYNTCDALKVDGVFGLNIFEKDSKVNNIREITKLFLADKGFYIFKIDKYLLRTIPGSNHKVDENGNPIIRDRSIGSNYEPIYMAKHYSQLYKEGLITKEQAIECHKRTTLDIKECDIDLEG